MSDGAFTKKRQQAVPRGPLNKLNQHDLRSKIQAGMLLKRLADHAFGLVELTQGQIKAIEILLRKSMPDLSATELTGANGGPVQTERLEVAYVPTEGKPAELPNTLQ